LAASHALFSDLELPEVEKGEARVSRIKRMGVNYDGVTTQPRVVRTVVEISRQVNGVEVLESRMRAIFDDKGQLFGSQVKWPEFIVKESKPLAKRDKALATLATHIDARTPPRFEIRESFSRLVYRLNEDDRTYEPTLATNVIWDTIDENEIITPPTQEVFYSLQEGVIAQ
jgi:hypothetical protein